MTVIKYIIGGLVLTLLIIAAYIAWQNRTSEKVISTFITVALAGAAATLAATIFSIKTESLEVSIFKTYVFDKISKYPLHNVGKSFVHAFSGPELEYDTWFLVQDSVKNDPSLALIQSDDPDKKLIDRGKSLYHDILFRQLLTMMCYHHGSNKFQKRTEDIIGSSVTYSIDRSSKIPSKSINWSEIVERNPNNSCLLFHQFDFCKLTVPSNASVSFSEHSIRIKDKFLDLTIDILDRGGSIGASGLKALLQMNSGESMKYWNETYVITVKANFSPIRNGHPLMADYKKWVGDLIKGITEKFSTEKHWEKAKELYQLHKDIPVETPEEAIRSQKEYQEWFAIEVIKHQKGSDKELSINKNTEQPNPADAKSRTAD